MRLNEITNKHQFSKFYKERNLISNTEKLQYLIDETGYNPNFNDSTCLLEKLDFLEDYVLRIWDKKSYFYFSIKNQENSFTRKGQLGILNKRLLKISEDFIELRDDIVNTDKFTKVFQTKETQEYFDELLKLTQDQLKSIRILILQAITNEDKDVSEKCADLFKQLVDKTYGSQQKPDPEIEKDFANIPDKYKCSGFEDTKDIQSEEPIRLTNNDHDDQTRYYPIDVRSLIGEHAKLPLENDSYVIHSAISKAFKKSPYSDIHVYFEDITITDVLAISLMEMIAKYPKEKRIKIFMHINNPKQQLLFDIITKKKKELKEYEQ